MISFKLQEGENSEFLIVKAFIALFILCREVYVLEN